MTFDYLLYDNRTLGPSGYDWAMKAATGRLQDHQKAKEKFAEYCQHSFDTRLRPLSNFGAALGGIPLKGSEYLLCVTLETHDLHQRPSCAFIGIHCPQSSVLKHLLMQGDPIVSAKQISENPGPKLILKGTSLVTDRLLIGGNSPAGRYPFLQGSTPRNVAEILLKHIANGSGLPPILGITQWNADRSRLISGYDFAYCLGLPKNEEVRQTSPSQKQTPESKPIMETNAWLLLGVLVICLSVGAFVWQQRSIITSVLINPLPVPKPTPSPVAQPQPNPSVQGDPDAFLKQFKELLDHIESASPNDLLTTREWKALNDVPVRPEHEPEREKMIKLLNRDLPRFQEAVKNKNLGYQFEAEPVRTRSSADRTSEIRTSASKIQPPTEGCTLIRSSFAVWTENSAAGKWCSLVEDFAKEIR